MALRTHLVEHESMAPDGLSARTEPLAAALACDLTFRDHASFVAAMATVADDLRAHPDDEHVVVLCTHGLHDTGTWIHVDDRLDDQHPEDLPHDLLRDRAGAVLIYCAVCWGGYPGLIRRFQHGDKPWPLVVGALAPLTAVEGNELQDELLRTVVAEGLSAPKMEIVVGHFNQKYAAEYGHPVARLAGADGRYSPAQGTAGIAWSLLRDDVDAPFCGPFEARSIDATSGNVLVSFDLNGPSSSRTAGGTLRRAKGAPVVVGDRFAFRAKRSPCGRYVAAVGDARVVT